MMLPLLADAATAPPNDMVSLGALGTFILGIGSIILTYFKRDSIKAQGRKEESERTVSLKTPVPQLDVTTREHPEFVTHQQLDGHLQRIEATFSEIKEALDGERGIARTANGKIHQRIDALSERFGDRLSKLEGVSQAVKETTDKLLDLALGKTKPPSR
jgi:hypothetical protein